MPSSKYFFLKYFRLSMFENKLSLCFFIMHTDKKRFKKKLSCNEEIRYCFVGGFVCFVLLVYQRIKKMAQERQDSAYSG